jgi:5'-nucleotidase
VNILIANDDGVFAPGIRALADALKSLGRVVIVAPEAERSGFSSALTLDRPLRPQQIQPDVWMVNGTPADCVYLATQGLFDFQFDLVVSGINSGANLGDDVLYSGTVGAAFEGRHLKLPALAISMCGQKVRQYQHAEDYAVAAAWVRDFIQAGLPKLPARHILNINIPDVEQIQGMKVTYQGRRDLTQPTTIQRDPRQRQVHWIGLANKPVNTASTASGCISDFEAIAQDYVSITPLQMDLTNYALLDKLQSDLVEQASS